MRWLFDFLTLYKPEEKQAEIAAKQDELMLYKEMKQSETIYQLALKLYEHGFISCPLEAVQMIIGNFMLDQGLKFEKQEQSTELSQSTLPGFKDL